MVDFATPSRVDLGLVANHSTTQTEAILIFQNVRADQLDEYDAGTGQWTPRYSGQYEHDVRVYSADSTLGQVDVYRDGEPYLNLQLDDNQSDARAVFVASIDPPGSFDIRVKRPSGQPVMLISQDDERTRWRVHRV